MIACAIAGLGRWGRSLVEAASASARLKITRAVETDLVRARPFCAERGIDLTGDFESVLADPAIDAILLATPHSLHRTQVIAAANAGKQVFCEKPLALRAVTRPRCSTPAAGPTCCWRSAITAASGLRCGRCARSSQRASSAPSFMSRATTATRMRWPCSAGWRLSPEELPGGGLTGAGLHVLDGFVSLLGPARRVYAQFVSRDPGPPPVDTALLALDFACGATGTLATVRTTPFYWRVHAFGTQGSAEVLDEVTMIVRKSGHQPHQIKYPAIDTLAAELDAFADAIVRKRVYPVPEADVLATLAAFEAALASMRSDSR